MSQLGADEGSHEEEYDEDEGTELAYNVYNVDEQADEEAGDEDPEGGEEGAM